jgi:hypothetical protein
VQLASQRLGGGGEAALGRAVVHHARVGRKRAGRGHVDDDAAPSRQHARKDSAGEEERHEQIQLEDRLYLGGADLPEAPDEDGAGAAHQHVDRSERRFSVGDPRGGGLHARQVGFSDARRATDLSRPGPREADAGGRRA